MLKNNEDIFHQKEGMIQAAIRMGHRQYIIVGCYKMFGLFFTRSVTVVHLDRVLFSRLPVIDKSGWI
jgi:hypothetical protein